MTDLDAIRARHVGTHACSGPPAPLNLYREGDCDTAIVLAALDAAKRDADERIGQLEGMLANVEERLDNYVETEGLGGT